MDLACKEAEEGIKLQHGGPFGACIRFEDRILSSAHNTVLSSNDPTCHAEVNAIRHVTAKYLLPFSTLYTTCEPCPMCCGAIIQAKIPRVVIGVDKDTAAQFGFDDEEFVQKVKGFYNRELKIDNFNHNLDFRSTVQNLFNVKFEKIYYHENDIMKLLNRTDKLCIVTHNGKIIVESSSIGDAVRKASKCIDSHVLDECDVYSLFEPTPYALGVLLWARVRSFQYAISRRIHFALTGDMFLINQIDKYLESNHEYEMMYVDRCKEIFEKWKANNGVLY